MNRDDEYPLTRALVNLSNLEWNICELKKMCSPGADFLAVVKADGYGHGSVEVAKIAIANGAKMLAVARLSEALKLRQNSIDKPILLFGYTHPKNIKIVHDNNFIISVNSFEAARQLNKDAEELGIKLKIHIKVDSGMGRLGFPVENQGFTLDMGENNLTSTLIEEIVKMPNLIIEGIYTHFANADTLDKTHAYMQLEFFNDLLDKLNKKGIEFKYIHAANSAGLMEISESHFNLVRPGIALYGLYPSDEVDKSKVELKPVMSIESTITHLKTVPAGFKVSYGSTFETKKTTKIATIPIGYADGYRRLLSSQSSMIVDGVKVPVLGRVCMDLTMLDVSELDNVKVGDKVIVMGEADNGVSITADDMAKQLGTINYEIVSALPARIPRIYI